MALTEKLQIRLSKAEKETIFRLAAHRSLQLGTKVSAANLLRGMVTEALKETEVAKQKTINKTIELTK